MKNSIYILTLVLLLLPGIAPCINLDSLWGVWNDTTQPDTNRLQAMHKIAWDGYLYSQPDSAYYFAQVQYDFASDINNRKYIANALNTQGSTYIIKGNYEEALVYLHKCLEIQAEIGHKSGMAKTYNNMGSIAKRKGNHDKALEYYHLSLEIKEAIGNKKGVATSYHNIGVIYQERGYYKQALECFQTGLEILTDIGDEKDAANTYNSIGNIYKYQGNYQMAIEYFQMCLEIKEDIGDKNGKATVYNGLGNVYNSLGNYKKSLQYYQMSLKMRKEIGSPEGVSDSYNNIGVIFALSDNHNKALEYFQMCLEIKEELGDKIGVATSYENIGAIYYGQGNYAQALDLAKKGLALSQKVGAIIQMKDASKLLYDVYKKTGQSAKALKMHKLYITMLDSVNSIENREAAIKLEYQHQYEKEQALAEVKHEEQMALSAERAKRQKLVTYSAGGGLVMVLLFAIFIFNRLQVTRRQKKVIQEHKEMVEEQKKDITDSIRYAENIQRALLPTIESINTVLPDSFVLFKPKDIVSGDFYWMQQHKGHVYFAACDCTGHGVPGAFMSMIGSSLLDEAVIEKGITKPNEIFFEVRKGFINALKQSGEAGQQKDGMDAALCSWDQNGTLQYALAYNPLLLIRNGELIESKPDKQPVGFHTTEQKPFTHHELKLEKGDAVYIFSDGYPDQFGGRKNKKFMMKNFKKLLLSIQDKTMNEQKTILETTMAEWKGDAEQIDDILVMGIRF